jgi:hypothetical protein
MDFKEGGLEGMDWIDPTPHKVKWFNIFEHGY